jgi:hypothetical protein
VWLNDGTGTFSETQSLGGSDSTRVALGDVDGDGDLDAFVVNGYFGSQPNKVWLNDGSGTFSDSGQSLGNSLGRGIALGDVDGDGDLDAFVANEVSQADKVWLNDGKGVFTETQSLGNSSSLGLALGDLDGDGDLDAFVAGWSNQPNTVWLNDGSGTFSDSGQSLGNSSSSAVMLGDLDSDGDLDAFVTNHFGDPNKVWLNDGLGRFIDSGQNLGSSRSIDVMLGDLDGDSDLDAFVANGQGQANKVWLNDGGAQGGTLGIFSDSGQSLGSSNSVGVALGDINGDDDLDAFLANGDGVGQANKVWLNQGELAGVRLTPPVQIGQGTRGQVVAYEETLINATGATDSFSLTLGSHAWDTALSTDVLGPVAHGDSLTFTVYVTISVDAAWYSTDIVRVAATSVTSPTVYSGTATFTSQAYAPPQISVSPDVLTSTQYMNEIVTKPLTISNGNGVTLTFNVEGIGNVFGEAALDFDGIDDELNMGTSDTLMLSDTDFTVEAWISTTSTTVDWILGNHDPGWSNGYGMTINHQDCAPNKACFGTGGGVNVAAMSTSDVNDGQWHHIARVYYVSGTERIFVDGILEDSNPASMSIPPNTDPFRVGYIYENHSREQFQGRIDEVHVWNIARTETEIQSTMNTPLIGNEPGLVGYWKFDEGSGQTAYDSTANGNDGQLGSTPGVDGDDPSWFLVPPQGGGLPPWLSTEPISGTVVTL